MVNFMMDQTMVEFQINFNLIGAAFLFHAESDKFFRLFF